MLPVIDPVNATVPVPTTGPDAPPRARLGWTVARLARSWRALLDQRLAPHNLTQSRWRGMNVVATEPRALTLRELAERLAIEAPTLVRLLDRLEADGLVTRCADPDDRRRKVIRLGPNAAPATRTISQAITEVRDDLLGDVPEERIVEALALLDMIQARTDRLLAGAAAADDDQGGAR